MKKAMKILVWVLWSILFLFLLITSIGVGSFAWGLLAAQLFITVAVLLGKKRSAQHKVDRAVAAENMANSLVPIAVQTVRMIQGLDDPRSTPCDIEVYAKEMCMKCGANNYNLAMTKIVDAQLYEDTEMRPFVRSSLFQTMLGGAAFGATGAIIGAMPETKYKKVISKYNLLVSYISDDEQKVLLFTCDRPMKGIGETIQQYKKGTKPFKTTEL